MVFKAHAKATITVELSGLGNWGPETTMQQIHDQAQKAAISMLVNHFNLPGQLRILGEPSISVVTISEK